MKKRAVVLTSVLAALVAILAPAFLLFPRGSVHANVLKGGQTEWTGTALPPTSLGGSGNTTSSITFNTIPYFKSQFTANGTVYPYRMVGTNPANGAADTTINVAIQPLDVEIRNSGLFYLNQAIPQTLNSPLFTPTRLPDGHSDQIIDDFMRNQFHTYVSTIAANYHVRLSATPQVLPVLTAIVPATQGRAISLAGHTYGIVNYDWWVKGPNGIKGAYDQYLTGLPANTMILFLTENLMVYRSDTGACCFTGLHSTYSSTVNGVQKRNSYVWASYFDNPLWVGGRVSDVSAISTQFGSWADDPFDNNTAPLWKSPVRPQFSCMTRLLAGVPLMGHTTTVRTNNVTYTIPDLAYFSWFARQSPSLATNGAYTYLNNAAFTTFSSSAGC